MKGAREYHDLFKTGQYGRLWIQCGSHARGDTFRIYVLSKGFVANDKLSLTYLNSVEVYGVVSGNPGWTESYGWLNKGPWVDDFNKLVSERKEVLRNEELIAAKNKVEKDKIKKERAQKILDQY